MNDHLLTGAQHEIAYKSREQIEEETAWKWAARAVASYQEFRRSNFHRWLMDAADYAHEAIEHGALADYDGAVLRAVRNWMARYIPTDAF